MTKERPFRTRLVRIGNSLGVRIPKQALEQVGLSTRLLQAGEFGPEVELLIEDDMIMIKPYRDASPSFEERIAPFIEEVTAAPPDAQELVLNAVAGAVNWLARARKARERLVPIIGEVYSQHKHEIEDLKQRGERIWERPDLLWFLIKHRVLTSQTEVVEHPSLSYDAVADLVRTEDTEGDPARRIADVLSSRGGANIGVRERAEALLRCYTQIADAGGLEAQTEQFRALTSAREMERFLWRFESGADGQHFSIYGVYDPLDELYSPTVNDQITMNSEMRLISEKLHLSGLYAPPFFHASSESDSDANDDNDDDNNNKRRDRSLTANERLYQQVAQQAGLDAWTLGRLVQRYYSKISHLLDEQSDAELSNHSTGSS